ncbi:hypothetical protein JMJ77_0005043 [Colletotrichum scovillei]|uniref:Uncharacterized protein n=1 Tax=Colletotrichum scovillei TaxID=1209932 RepID=A0A9P7RFZ1_9PEZI|nr:hypothetical protein JMJ77_0005043 [Colletotrichum scovillei]KAG7076310.1 hypothetical protein JMJ76_0013575 [Colletotrichum scovillei]KAG7083389.1 hypothetical protein JMJ78_0008835 [Colletotrichum scovillei]
MRACSVRRPVRGDSIPGPTLATLWLEFDVTLRILRTDRYLSAPSYLRLPLANHNVHLSDRDIALIWECTHPWGRIEM